VCRRKKNDQQQSRAPSQPGSGSDRIIFAYARLVISQKWGEWGTHSIHRYNILKSFTSSVPHLAPHSENTTGASGARLGRRLQHAEERVLPECAGFKAAAVWFTRRDENHHLRPGEARERAVISYMQPNGCEWCATLRKPRVRQRAKARLQASVRLRPFRSPRVCGTGMLWQPARARRPYIR
jgi:hypothetical protein